jgi:hypothetical protein
MSIASVEKTYVWKIADGDGCPQEPKPAGPYYTEEELNNFTLGADGVTIPTPYGYTSEELAVAALLRFTKKYPYYSAGMAFVLLTEYTIEYEGL